MAFSDKSLPSSVSSLGLGDVLKAQLEVQSEAARKSALKNQGANDAVMSMSPETQQLFSFLSGGGTNGGLT